MTKLLHSLIPSLDTHLTDDRLASLICGELPFVQRWIARTHLKQCWQCRLRKDDLEGRRAPRMLDRFREGRRGENVSDKSRMEFSRSLRRQIDDFTPQETKSFRFPKISLPEFPPMNPALVTCMVFAFAALFSFYFWWHQRAPRISSNALLVRAEKWDTPNPASSTGVVYQSVRITVSNKSKTETVSRSIYRDMQGKRRPKQARLDRTEEQLRNTLTEAGLDWDEPLSASGYQKWHDHQHVREDHIARAGTHLLQLTTSVPDGVIAEQSLTVRDTDFHPVRRTLALRGNGTVDIAELDYKILPWGAVDANVFEPPFDRAGASITAPVRVLAFPRLPDVLTDMQLDEAELGARLVLNQLHADTGEQLEIHRNPHGVLVGGLVESEERKHELQARLDMVPHVTVAVQTVQDVTANPSSEDAVQSIATGSMPEQSSPLQVYMRAQGRGVGDINSLAQRLFQNALAISQESKDILDLQTRFGGDGQRTILASATLSQLIYSHHGRLEAGLRRERALLAEARNAASASQDSEGAASGSLAEAADRNLRLARELTQTNHPVVRTADKILAEMALAMDDLTADAHEAYGKSQSNTALGGKK